MLLVVADGALARASDGAVTQAYVQANYAAVRIGASHIAASEAGTQHVLAQVQSECPHVGAGSPQDAESTEMSNEVIGAILKAAIAPNVQAITSFVHTASALSWSSPGLTRAVHAYAQDWKTLLELPTPDPCADIKAWGAAGYRALPASTLAFAPKFMGAWVAAGFLPAQLSRYESASTKALARRSHPFEEQLGEFEVRQPARYSEIMDELGIWP
jgi:hypothetical protein